MLQEFTPGQVVISKSGRDKGRCFIVVKADGAFIYVVDGDLRKIENPKKKNSIHLTRTNILLDDIVAKLANGETLRNADFRKALSLIAQSSAK